MGIFKIFGYGLGSMSNNFIMGVFQSFLLIFYTDVFGIPAMAVSVIFLISKIWDAVNDPMMGAIVDKSPVTRFGKYRPYICIPSTGNCGIPVLLYTELQCWRQDRICGYYIHVVWYDLYSI